MRTIKRYLTTEEGTFLQEETNVLFVGEPTGNINKRRVIYSNTTEGYIFDSSNQYWTIEGNDEEFYIKDSTGNYFTVEYNEETDLYHYKGDSNYTGYSLDECLLEDMRNESQLNGLENQSNEG